MLINPKPDSAVSTHDKVYRGLRSQIMYGEIAPGAALTLRGIGAEYGVSMTPAREAVRRLVAEARCRCRRRAGWPRPSCRTTASRSWRRCAR